ncbi:phage tail protein [Escherichia coli]|uniref:phage tail-collar fiber domain-containing protein n=1 Tax=Escherichia coli TaxID=562 RepID=UPI00346258F6
MATKYYALLTNVGAAKLANATALGEQVEITQMAVGDGNGALPTPNPAQTALVHELRRAPLNTLTIDPVNTNQIIAEQVIPEDVGGWWIREIGLYDSDGDMIAVANCAETYKPLLQEGSGRMQVIRVILIVSSTQAVTLKIDPSVVLATRQYVDDQIIQVKAFVDQQLAAHIAAADPHKQYAPKASPALTGTPTAPTAAQTVNNTQIATTGFVKSAIAALVASSPAALDTLNELAAALGNDPNFATTVTNALAGKQPLDSTLTNLSGKTVNGILQYLGLGEGSALPVGVPVPWPSATPPTGWLKCNGAAFSAEEYPELAKAYPTNKLPDLRGEFIRGWDDGRNVDAGRALLSQQGDAMQKISGTVADNAMGASASGSGAMTITGEAGITYYASATPSSSYIYYRKIGIDSSLVARTANENRPRNIAFNYIVRAA